MCCTGKKMHVLYWKKKICIRCTGKPKFNMGCTGKPKFNMGCTGKKNLTCVVLEKI